MHVSKKRVFIAIHEPSYEAMYELALEAGKNKENIIILTEKVIKFKEECQEAGFRIFQFPQMIEIKKSSSVGKKKSKDNYLINEIKVIKNKIKEQLVKKPSYLILNILIEMVEVKRFSKRMKNFIDTESPNICYIYHDMLGGSFALFHKLLKEQNVKIVGINSAYQDPEIPAEQRAKSKYFNITNKAGLTVSYIRKNLPQQIYLYNNNEILFYRDYEIIAWYLCAFLPSYPWISGKNFCDVIFVEDEKIKERKIKQKLHVENVKVENHIKTDELYHIMQKSYKAKKEKNKNESITRLVLSASNLKKELNWDEKYYRDHLKDTRDIILESNKEIIYILHPKATFEDFKFLKNNKIKFSKGQTAKEIAETDIYISYASSTIYWGILAEKFCLNLWPIYSKDDSFGHLKSVIRVENLMQLKNKLQKLISSQDYRLNIKQKILHDKKTLLQKLDGKAKERILNV